MLRALALLTIGLACLMAGGDARAQEGPVRGQLERNAPLVTPENMMTKEMASALFQQCRSFYPRRFTPSALDRYCDCAIPSTQLALTGQEYAELQEPRNRVIGNTVFQKYIAYVVAPCMDLPTQDIEYMSCVLDRHADSRVGNFPRYCQCVAKDMQKHVAEYGDVEILITMQTNRNIIDPFEALWMNDRYIQSVRNARDSCLATYMERPVTYN